MGSNQKKTILTNRNEQMFYSIPKIAVPFIAHPHPPAPYNRDVYVNIIHGDEIARHLSGSKY